MTELQYIKNNIALIQKQKKWNTETKKLRDKNEIPFRNHTEVTKYLFDRLKKFSKKKKEKMYKEWSAENFLINKISTIAEKNFIYTSHLQTLLKNILKKKIIELYDEKKINLISNKIINDLDSDINKGLGFKVIKTDIKKVLPNSIYFALNAGFFKNLINVKPGEDSTYFGQAAQFLFLARALRAGYNASNVDLPSSKYDAILDTGNNEIVTIQIKGTETTTISFFTRARGGEGIDSKDKTNQQVRITSKMCDFYVAVDHLIGTCYIIPLQHIDKNYTDKQAKSVKLSELSFYKEAWNLFDKKNL